ncbi:MAG: hypothetical protein AMJ81_12955 [Phycisphaerae bacterium SM23_33]|nr:MAG: hypothetical protein AMJ81_12955 [Phycisphaerae bacterium SM23_33]
MPARRARDYRVVHVFVALCDNRNQGIVPVRAALGNGQDPKSNLYWGAMYGVKTYFRQRGHWEAAGLAGRSTQPAVLDRAVFRSRWQKPTAYVVADAYDGARMKAALTDFFNAAAGATAVELSARFGLGTVRLQAGGHADLVCFVGHNGLMDLKLPALPQSTGGPSPDCAVVLACNSRPYFAGPLGTAGCSPLITTTGLMAPEAYTLDAVIRSWAAGETPQQTRERAAHAYAKYQRCGLEAARGLFAAGAAAAGGPTGRR